MIMQRIAVFPGSFDPITLGHQDVVLRAIPLFDRIIIGIGHNSAKRGLFSISRRRQMIAQVFSGHPSVSVEAYEGLTADFCKRVGATRILRGLRNGMDLEFERSIADAHLRLVPGLETVFLLSSPQFMAINSTIVRDVLHHGGDATSFVPAGIDLDVRD
jgi:pantetheine-phosphate adenylyltransferase